MKIGCDWHLVSHSWIQGLHNMAAELSMIYDVYIKAEITWHKENSEAYFVLGSHKCNNLDELKRVLKLKAFI